MRPMRTMFKEPDALGERFIFYAFQLKYSREIQLSNLRHAEETRSHKVQCPPQNNPPASDDTIQYVTIQMPCPTQPQHPVPIPVDETDLECKSESSESSSKRRKRIGRGTDEDPCAGKNIRQHLLTSQLCIL